MGSAVRRKTFFGTVKDFDPNQALGSAGILCVFQGFQCAELEQKIHCSRKKDFKKCRHYAVNSIPEQRRGGTHRFARPFRGGGLIPRVTAGLDRWLLRQNPAYRPVSQKTHHFSSGAFSIYATVSEDQIVIANQSSDWCGNPPIEVSAHKMMPIRIIQGIPTPVCALARNDIIFHW